MIGFSLFNFLEMMRFIAEMMDKGRIKYRLAGVMETILWEILMIRVLEFRTAYHEVGLELTTPCEGN